MEINLFSDNETSHLFINPHFQEDAKKHFTTLFEKEEAFKGHIWLSTSGSSCQKWVLLSKKAILASAEAVNTHLQSSNKDCWIQGLPSFHIGGLSIRARAFLSGAKVETYQEKWNVHAFYQFVVESQGTLVSLVPTQLYDLVCHGYAAPKKLRAAIIGGGRLFQELYEKARALGWPILVTYGMTECASQVATSSLDEIYAPEIPSLKLLSHFETKIEGGLLCLKGKSLFTTYATFGKETVDYFSPKVDEWFVTEDRAVIEKETLCFEGRKDSIVKIGGENVDFVYLEGVLQSVCLELGIPLEPVLSPLKEERLGVAVSLLLPPSLQPFEEAFVTAFNKKVLPFERIRSVEYRKEPLRSILGKPFKVCQREETQTES